MTNGNVKKAQHKVSVPFSEFAERIKAVARGEAPLPAWAGKRVYASDEARQYWQKQTVLDRARVAGFAKLLSDNQDLLGALRTKHPVSVSALAKLVNRSDSNVSRSLGKLEKLGIVELLIGHGKSKQPVLATDRVVIEIDLGSGEAIVNRRTAEDGIGGRKASTARKTRALTSA